MTKHFAFQEQSYFLLNFFFSCYQGKAKIKDCNLFKELATAIAEWANFVKFCVATALKRLFVFTASKPLSLNAENP